MPRRPCPRASPPSGRDRPRDHHAGRDAAARRARPVGAHRHDRRRRRASPGPPTQLGYHHLTCSEHVAVPVDVAETRGSRYWDPLATLGLPRRGHRADPPAAERRRARLPPPAGHREAYGTLDQVSGGRLVLGVGVGSLAEEFDAARRPVRRPGRPGRRGPAGDPGDDVDRAVELPGHLPRVVRHGRRTGRRAVPRADLGRRSDRPVAAPGRRAGRRLGARSGSRRRRPAR